MKLVDKLGERYHFVFQCDEMSDLGFKKCILVMAQSDYKHLQHLGGQELEPNFLNK